MSKTYSWAFQGRTYDPRLDFGRLSTQLARVLGMLLDGRWHALHDLRARCGSAADSRMRDLRHREFGCMVVHVYADPCRAGVNHYQLDLDSADPQVVAAVLRGDLARIPRAPSVPGDPAQIRSELHTMVDQFDGDGRCLRNVWRLVLRELKKDGAPGGRKKG